MVPLQEGLEAKHMEMALETHRKTVQAMFDLNVEEFFHRVSSQPEHPMYRVSTVGKRSSRSKLNN